MAGTIDRYKQARFIEANGRILRRINILRYEYIALPSVERIVAQEGVKSHEFMDAVNYLQEAGYIKLRHITSHEGATLADGSYHDLEAKLTALGIRLLAGGVTDSLVEV